MEQIGIVGAGAGGTSLLRTFLATPSVRVIGVADPDLRSPGIILAKQFRVYTTKNFRDFSKIPGTKILFDATGVPAVAAELDRMADETTAVIRPEVAKLIWEMVDAKEETNKMLIRESDLLLRFIERSLEHIEILNSEHGRALQQVAEEIRELSKLTTESQALVQDMADVMGLIKNVADHTRILGINASIESARAGDYGRGFGVVADSIHQLSASSLKSVDSVSVSMDGIRRVLRNIDHSVGKVVDDVQRIESNQAALAEELHVSLEEMVASTKKLATIAGQEQK